MLHCAAVDVSCLRYELQSEDLIKGTVFAGDRNIDAGSICHILSIFGPINFDGGRIEPRNMTDQSVLLSQLHLIPAEDD